MFCAFFVAGKFNFLFADLRFEALSDGASILKGSCSSKVLNFPNADKPDSHATSN
jgi:hypothetical protein